MLFAGTAFAGEREEHEERERERQRPRVSTPRTATSRVSAVDQEQAGPVLISRSDITAMLPAEQAVTIDNPYGDVHVRFGGFEHRIECHLVLQEPEGSAHIELKPQARDGERRYLLAARLPKGAILREGQRLDLSVLLAEDHDLRVRTEHGFIDVHGVRADVDLASVDGNIEVRGVRGSIQAQTGSGMIEAALGKAPRNSTQRLATTTGDIRVGVDDHLDAELAMSTANQFATDYSLTVTRRTGEERNKLAQAVIGENHARIVLESARGEIRLLRRARFTKAGAPADEAEQDEEMEDNDSD
jgi:hypothetical protein